MADQNSGSETTTTDAENTYSTPENDPKNMQEVTHYVSVIIFLQRNPFSFYSIMKIN